MEDFTMYKETEINSKLEIFRERLKELRGNSRLQDVAKDIGISRASLGYYENGDRKPDIEILMKLADYYHVSSDYLLGMSDVKKADSTIQSMVLKTGLSENVINKLCYYKERMTEFTDSLNIVLKSTNFEKVLSEVKEYMDAVKMTDELTKIRRKRREEVFSKQPDGPNGSYNWPYNDNLDEIWSESHQKEELSEFHLDMHFKFLIRELAKLAGRKYDS